MIPPSTTSDSGAGLRSAGLLDGFARQVVEWIVGDAAPADATDVSLEFATPVAPWGWFLVALAAAAIAWWSYRRLAGSTRGAAGALRFLAASSRAASLFLVALLLAGPMVRYERLRIERDRLVVLVDRSRSLEIADAPGGSTRDVQASRFLEAAGPALRRVAESKEVDFIGFAAGTFPFDPGAPGEPVGDRTDLDGALRQALARAAGRPVSGILVVSDGRSSVPVAVDTMRALERESVPVFAAALGSAVRLGDAAIVEVGAPDRAFLRDRVPVEVRVDRGGISGGLSVRLVDVGTGAEIARSELPATSGEATVVLDGSTTSAGARAWRIELVGERADLVRENDVREIAVEFVDRPVRVLYVEGASRWEYRYLKNVLLRERDVESSIMLLSADRDFAQEGNLPITRIPRTREEFAGYDLFILGDVPSGYFSPEQLAAMRAQVSERGAGLLWIGGERATPSSWESTPLADLLPFRPPLGLEPRSGATQLRPTPDATRLGVLRLSDDDDGWPDPFVDPGATWNKLRYVQSVPRARLKPTSEVLALAEGLGAAAEEPGAAVMRMRFGAGDVIYVATDEIWRWRYGQGERYPERFWIPIVRLLAREAIAGGDARATLAVAPARLAPGETALVSLRIGEEDAAEQAPAVVPVEVIDDRGVAVGRVELARDGSEASAMLPVGGVGRYRAVADDPAFGRVEAAFEVVRRDDELRRGDADHEALADLATRTGGRMVGESDVAQLPDLLPRRAREIDESVVRSLSDVPAAFALLLSLLAFEWIGRRLMRLV